MRGQWQRTEGALVLAAGGELHVSLDAVPEGDRLTERIVAEGGADGCGFLPVRRSDPGRIAIVRR
jgi:hypothetical protein